MYILVFYELYMHIQITEWLRKDTICMYGMYDIKASSIKFPPHMVVEESVLP